jgi:NAD(P)H-hydrate epimerase
LFTGNGPDYVGQVRSASLDLPESVFAAVVPAAWRIDAAFLRAALPPRRRTSHKGDFGHVLVIGGRPGLSGATRLAAEAAARSGAGWVSVATHPEHAAWLNNGRPELMCHAVDSADALEPLLARASVVAVGPGLGRERWAETLLAELWDSPLPLILDADALNLLAQAPRRRDNWVLTPHPGEAARLLGITVAAVQADRPAAATALQTRFGGVVVLKGSGTLISDGHSMRLSSTGNPGMASGGMGDLLTGVIAGLVAQGLALPEAAAGGVVAHGLAGDAAARAGGERGLLAGDLLLELRPLLNPAS